MNTMKLDMWVKCYQVKIAKKELGEWHKYTIRKQNEEEAIGLARTHIASGHKVEIEVVSVLDGWQE